MPMNQDFLKANLTNPLRTFIWDVIVPTVIGGGNSDVLQARARSASIPARSVGAILVPYKQTAGIKFPGKLTYDHTWAVTFIEGEDNKVHSAIYAWQQQLVHDQTGIGAGDDKIKTNLYFNMVSTKGEDIRQIKLIGCYPESVGAVEMTQDGEGLVNFAVTFAFDSWEVV